MLQSSLHTLTRAGTKTDYLELKQWVDENVVGNLKLSDFDTHYKNLTLTKLIYIGMRFSPSLSTVIARAFSKLKTMN